MANLNRIILIGRLTADPEMRTTMDSIPVTKFQMAVDRNRGAGAQKEADIIDIVAWRNVAEAASGALSKGQLVLVEGRIQNRSFETKEGQRKYVTEIIASNIAPIEKSKISVRQAQPAAAAADNSGAEGDFLEEDLPF